MTSLYMFRLFLVAFCGQPRSSAAESAQENSSLMTLPLVILAFLSVVGGYQFLWPDVMFEAFREDLQTVDEMPNHMWMIALGTFAWLVGVFGARKLYCETGQEDPLSERIPVFFRLCASKLFFDDIYNFYVNSIQQRFARVSEVFELLFLSGLMVRGSAGVAGLLALFGKTFYLGRLNVYGLWFLLGVLGFLAYASGWFGQ